MSLTTLPMCRQRGYTQLLPVSNLLTMSTINVYIQSLEDVAQRKPTIPDLDQARAQPAHATDLAILEAGCVSGNTSVILVLRDAEGKALYYECSAQQFETMAGAVRGAVARFGK